MYGKSNMETYITLCKIDSQWEFAVCLRKFKQGLCINLEGCVSVRDWREVHKGEDICISMADSLESPLDCKEIQPIHPKGDSSWVFIGRTDAEAETPILWQPHVKS